MTLMLVMNLGFAGGTASGVTFKAAWAKGANVVVTPTRTA